MVVGLEIWLSCENGDAVTILLPCVHMVNSKKVQVQSMLFAPHTYQPTLELKSLAWLRVFF
jgi:hypothetical protein